MIGGVRRLIEHGIRISLTLRTKILSATPTREIVPSKKMLAVLASFLVLPLIPPLFDKVAWRLNPFRMMAFLGVICAVSERWMSKLPPLQRLRKPFPFNTESASSILLAVAVVGYAAYFSFYTVLNHYQLGTSAYDLGLAENTISNTLRGYFFGTSYDYTHNYLLSGHFSPIYALIVPFYALWPRTETLLVIQSVLIALGAVPLYLFARKILGTGVGALAIAASYLLHPANHGANFYDFHEMAFFPFLAISLFYFMENENIYFFFATFLLCLLIKEDIALALIPVAAFLLLSKKRPAYAIPSMIFTMLWYLGVQYLLITVTGSSSTERWGPVLNETLFPRGGGFPAFVKQCISNPAYVLTQIMTGPKILYFLQLFFPVALLPLLRAGHWLLFGYGLAVCLLASWFPHYDIGFQYVWYTLPFIYVSTVYALSHIAANGSKFARLPPVLFRLTIIIMMCSFVFSWQYGAVLNRTAFRGGFRNIDFKYTDEEKENLKTLRSIIAEIPLGASITASETICPHLSRFRTVQTSRYFARETDYVLLFAPEITPDPLYSTIRHRPYTLLKSAGIFHLWKLKDGAAIPTP